MIQEGGNENPVDILLKTKQSRAGGGKWRGVEENGREWRRVEEVDEGEKQRE